LTNTKAIKVLRTLRGGITPDAEHADQVAEAREAIALAISALGDPMLDRKKAAAKGGDARAAKYKLRHFRKWGKLGGRPKKKAA